VDFRASLSRATVRSERTPGHPHVNLRMFPRTSTACKGTRRGRPACRIRVHVNLTRRIISCKSGRCTTASVELVQSCFAFEQQDGHAVFHGKFHSRPVVEVVAKAGRSCYDSRLLRHGRTSAASKGNFPGILHGRLAAQRKGNLNQFTDASCKRPDVQEMIRRVRITGPEIL